MHPSSTTWALILLATTGTVSAVQQNINGTGQVLIYPYYTVNNGLNTLYSVVNTTGDTKAIKVKFMESDIGLEVLDFNVYLSGYDVWTGALIADASTIGTHVGEPNAKHLSTDTSCAPFLIKAGQEFLPFVIDLDLDQDNKSMQRATEGHMEVIEMATFTGQTVAWADHGTVGVPASCALIENDWADNNIYDTADEADPSGGLTGSASIINVSEGIAFTYDAVALQNFWQGAGMHTTPGELAPNLNSAEPESTVLLADGSLAQATWNHGFQAVSEVLTQAEVYNEYALEVVINARSEWVINYPTKRFHSQAETATAPFVSVWDGANACESYEISIWDRESQILNDFNCVGSPCPPRPLSPMMCHSTNVMDYYGNGVDPQVPTAVLGSANELPVFVASHGVTESGRVTLYYPDAAPTTPISGPSMAGLPVTGFAVMQFTNAGAAQGLLAQYGALFSHKYKGFLNPEQ